MRYDYEYGYDERDINRYGQLDRFEDRQRKREATRLRNRDRMDKAHRNEGPRRAS